MSWGGSYGYYIQIDHGGGLEALYAHCSIIFEFHGYPTLVHELTYERTNRNLSVHGYQEEGAITMPFDMRVQNEIDRFHLVRDVLLHLPQLGNRGAYLIQQMNDKLVAHKNYIHEIGQDMPEILDWKWHLPENK